MNNHSEIFGRMECEKLLEYLENSLCAIPNNVLISKSPVSEEEQKSCDFKITSSPHSKFLLDNYKITAFKLH